MDLERQLNNYRAAWAYIESIDDSEREAEEIYEDLYGVVQLRRVFAETSRETGLARVIFLLGPSGSGKTMAQALAARQVRRPHRHRARLHGLGRLAPRPCSRRSSPRSACAKSRAAQATAS